MTGFTTQYNFDVFFSVSRSSMIYPYYYDNTWDCQHSQGELDSTTTFPSGHESYHRQHCTFLNISEYQKFDIFLSLYYDDNFVTGKTGLVECAYVASNITDASYFASPILLGQNGVERNLGVGQLSDFEAEKLDKEVLPELKKNIAKGEEFVANYGKAEQNGPSGNKILWIM